MFNFITACGLTPTNRVDLRDEKKTANTSTTGKTATPDKNDRVVLLERRKTEVLNATTELSKQKMILGCGEGGVWGYFIQDPKNLVDGWDISKIKGNFKTFIECETARQKIKNSFFTEKCDAKKLPQAKTYKVVRATFEDNSGNSHALYFSSVDVCKKALVEGIHWYHVKGYQHSAEETIDYIEPAGRGYGSFNSDCEVETKDACNESGEKIELQL